jgi:hypothetical protein
MPPKSTGPKTRSPSERARKLPSQPFSAKAKEATGESQAQTPSDFDELVNQHLAAFRTADQTLADAKALVQTYRGKYPELATYVPEGPGEERLIQIREDLADPAAGSHKFRIRVKGRTPRYETRAAGDDEYHKSDASRWTQAFKDQLAVSVAKVILAREAAQGPSGPA